MPSDRGFWLLLITGCTTEDDVVTTLFERGLKRLPTHEGGVGVAAVEGTDPSTSARFVGANLELEAVPRATSSRNSRSD